ncbi:hypothetical protein Cgig2_028178 [Carnegiea gigantea]|uniref:F-box domain-containing protein n=1 Tax=Carnegiea gigantea TaxID=171969 RepID=A0A9Q1GUS2_9CARY|nr:hypothetical protein Cgig2_028178 [Carnegiea gigantea]
MAELPDELWRRILEMGVSASSSNPNPNRLTFKDLCCISISCRRFRRLSNDDSLWSSLLSSDFPAYLNTDNIPSSSSTTTNSRKSLYGARYEKDKARRVAAHRRAVLRIESRIAEYTRRLQELEDRRAEEADKIRTVASELSNLHEVSQGKGGTLPNWRASVALNVWQPEVIRGRQKQIVEQCPVPVDSRINVLEMELKLCKQQIAVFEKTYVKACLSLHSKNVLSRFIECMFSDPLVHFVWYQRDEKQRLEAAKEQLSSMMYHPLQDGSTVEQRVGDHSHKRKKLKRDTTAKFHIPCCVSQHFCSN